MEKHDKEAKETLVSCDERIDELNSLIATLKPTDKWKFRKELGTLLNQLEEFSNQVNVYMDRKDYLNAADSLMDVYDTIHKINKLMPAKIEEVPAAIDIPPKGSNCMSDLLKEKSKQSGSEGKEIRHES